MTKILKISFYALLILSSFRNGYSNETLSLNELKRYALNNNLDLKVQYEKYYQTQQEIKIKLGEFLPRLDIQLLYFNNLLSVFHSVVPIPSNWFEYQASIDMAYAQKYSNESIKQNMLKNLVKIFTTVKYQQQLLKSLFDEKKIYKDIFNRTSSLEQIGLATKADLFKVQRNLMIHEQQIYNLESIIYTQLSGLYQIIDRDPDDLLILGDLPNTTRDYPATTEEAFETAKMNSPELKANTFMREAALHQKKSSKISFISFSGIGFEYISKLNIDKSTIKEIDLRRIKIVNEIKRQITVAYFQLGNYQKRLENQENIIKNAQGNSMRMAELFSRDLVSFDELMNARIAYIHSKRKLLSVKLDYEIVKIELDRLLSLDVIENDIDNSLYYQHELLTNIQNVPFGKKIVYVDLNLDDKLKENVVSLEFSGDIFSYHMKNTNDNFSLFTKTRQTGEKMIVLTLLLINGEKIKYEKIISL